MFLKFFSASLIAFFSMVGFSGRAIAFPGEPFEQYRLKFGTPSNADPSGLRKAQENMTQFYWMEAEADPLLTGKKVKGNVVVLFKKNPVQVPGKPASGLPKLISTREIYLVRISADAFHSLLESFSDRWKIVSKRSPVRSFRSSIPGSSRTERFVRNGSSGRGTDRSAGGTGWAALRMLNRPVHRPERVHPVSERIDSQVDRSERSYVLYQLVSADGRFNAEMSYSPLEAIVPFPSAFSKTTTPVFNLWIYITQSH